MESKTAHKIVVLGCGAIGGLAGIYLSDAGYDVTLTDKWEEHVEAIKAGGMRTDGVRGERHFNVKACHVRELKENLDYLIIATKSHHTAEAIESVRHLITPSTTVISMQNGFNVEILANYVSEKQIVGTVPNYGGALVEPGHLEFVHEGPIHIGELTGEVTDRLKWLKEAYSNLTTTYVTDNIMGEIWGKQCYFSQITLTALVDAPVHAVLDVPEYRRLGFILVREALDVADAAKVVIPPSASFDPAMYRTKTSEDTKKLEAYWDKYLDQLSRHQMKDTHNYVKTASGVWWDIVYRRRKSETQGLTGAVVDKAKLYGVNVPLNERLVQMIYEIEAGKRSLEWDNIRELDDYRKSLGLELP